MPIYIIAFIVAVSLAISPDAFAKTTYSHKLCKQDDLYTCYKVQRGDSWKSLFADETERDIVMRVNRTNNKLRSGKTLAIPKNLEGATMLDFSPFKTQIDPPGKKTIVISLSHLAFGAYDPDGTLTYWGPVSGGKGWCPDINRGCNSPKGKFAIYRKGSKWCKSSKYPVGRGGAPMPYCMFFKGGFALHGSNDVPGYNASHGCVRMFTKDARFLNKDFTAGEKRVPVIVHK